MTKNTIKIYCDGGSRGNPGPAATGFLAVVEGKIVHTNSIYLGVATNNVAEYSAVIDAVKWLVKNKKKYLRETIILYLDSELVVKQLKGEYKVKNEKLKNLNLKIKKDLSKIENVVTYKNIAREYNKLADRLVNEELDRAQAK